MGWFAAAIPAITAGISAASSVAGAAGAAKGSKGARYQVDPNTGVLQGGLASGATTPEEQANADAALKEQAAAAQQAGNAAFLEKYRTQGYGGIGKNNRPTNSAQLVLDSTRGTVDAGRIMQKVDSPQELQKRYVESISDSSNQASNAFGAMGAKAMGEPRVNYTDARRWTGASGDLNRLRSTDAMMLQAAEGRVPSVAELQGQQQAQMAARNAYGLAASTRGASAGALAARAAIGQQGDIQAQAAQNAAMLRAQEMSQARGQLMDLRGTVAGMSQKDAMYDTDTRMNDRNWRYNTAMSAFGQGEQARQFGVQSGLQARGLVSSNEIAREQMRLQAHEGAEGRTAAGNSQDKTMGYDMFKRGMSGASDFAANAAKGSK